MPCLRRAAAVEEYGHRAELVVEADAEGGEEGWVTADAGGRAGTAGSGADVDGFEEIPSAGAVGGAGVEEVGGAAEEAGGGDSDSDVPDIADLELEEGEEERDEVRASLCYAVVYVVVS